MSARSVPSSGPGRDAIDIEAYVRGFGRRRPDVRIAVPRFADIIGPTLVTPLTRYFALSPVRADGARPRCQAAVGARARCRRSDGTPCGGRLLGHGQRCRGWRDHPCAGDSPGRPGAAGGPGDRPGRVEQDDADAPDGRLLPGTGQTAVGGPGAGHHQVAGARRLRPPVHHHRGVRRLRETLRPALAPATVRQVEVRIARCPRRPTAARRSGPGHRQQSHRWPVRPRCIDAPDDDSTDPVADPIAADELGIIDDQRIGRPRLVGITGDAAGTPRRRRSR